MRRRGNKPGMSYFDHGKKKIFFSKEAIESFEGDEVATAALAVHEWRHWKQYLEGFCQDGSQKCQRARELDAVAFTANTMEAGIPDGAVGIRDTVLLATARKAHPEVTTNLIIPLLKKMEQWDLTPTLAEHDGGFVVQFLSNHHVRVRRDGSVYYHDGKRTFEFDRPDPGDIDRAAVIKGLLSSAPVWRWEMEFDAEKTGVLSFSVPNIWKSPGDEAIGMKDALWVANLEKRLSPKQFQFIKGIIAGVSDREMVIEPGDAAVINDIIYWNINAYRRGAISIAPDNEIQFYDGIDTWYFVQDKPGPDIATTVDALVNYETEVDWLKQWPTAEHFPAGGGVLTRWEIPNIFEEQDEARGSPSYLLGLNEGRVETRGHRTARQAARGNLLKKGSPEWDDFVRGYSDARLAKGGKQIGTGLVGLAKKVFSKAEGVDWPAIKLTWKLKNFGQAMDKVQKAIDMDPVWLEHLDKIYLLETGGKEDWNPRETHPIVPAIYTYQGQGGKVAFYFVRPFVRPFSTREGTYNGSTSTGEIITGEIKAFLEGGAAYQPIDIPELFDEYPYAKDDWEDALTFAVGRGPIVKMIGGDEAQGLGAALLLAKAKKVQPELANQFLVPLWDAFSRARPGAELEMKFGTEVTQDNVGRFGLSNPLPTSLWMRLQFPRLGNQFAHHFVVPGDERHMLHYYQQLTGHYYFMDPDNPEDFPTLMQDLQGDRYRLIDAIVAKNLREFRPQVHIQPGVSSRRSYSVPNIFQDIIIGEGNLGRALPPLEDEALGLKESLALATVRKKQPRFVDEFMIPLLKRFDDYYNEPKIDIRTENTKFPQIFDSWEGDFRFSLMTGLSWVRWEFEIWGDAVWVSFPDWGKFIFEGELGPALPQLQRTELAKFTNRTVEEMREEFVLETILSPRPATGYHPYIAASTRKEGDGGKVYYPPNIFEGLLVKGKKLE